MTNKTMIAKAVKAALFGGIAASLAITAPVATAAEEGEEAERMVVTGSRIKRVDIENATPVISITSEDLEDSGRLTVADALRNATFNSFGSFSEQSGSSAQSQATVSLLGAGSNRTLVLLDGKRIPGSPSLGGTAVNLNTIPMAAVDRIDVMKDAGSAVYGSDAIAGVINIITKKDYDGVNIAGGLGRPSKEGADSETFSVTMGATSDRGNITLAFDHEVVDAVFDKDRPYTAATMNDTNGDGVISIYSETTGISYYGATITNPNTGRVEASPLCNSLTSSVPGFVGVLDGAVFGGGTVCGYAYANISANKASINRNSVFVNGNYTINDDLEFFSRMLVVHNRSFGRYAPPAAAWSDIPVGNANNPFSVPVDGYFRWYQLGPRDNNIDDHSADYLAGLRGTFGESAEWEVAYHYNQADYKSVGNTYLSYSGLEYNLTRPTPIALDSPRGVRNMSATTLRNDRNIMHQITAGIGFELGELGGGAAAFYVGGETMKYRYSATVDRQSEAGLIGGSSGNSAARNRDVTAYYAEAALPFTSNFDVNLAARMDDYSDFGSEFSPKVSFSYRPIDSLLLRASWGEGFRAPTLSELSAADSFSAESAVDYAWCFGQSTPISAADCRSRQYDTTVQSNANLSAEESEFINLGAVWNATDDFVVRFDYADVAIENAIGYVSVQNLIYQEMLGLPLTSGTSIRRRACPGGGVSGVNCVIQPIDEADTISANGASLNIRNVDLELTYKLPVSFGDFNFKWITSKILDYKSDVVFSGPLQDTVGFAGAPSIRSQFTTVFSSGDHRVAWNMDYIKGTYADSAPDVTATSVRLNPTGFIDSLLIHNLAYTYNAGDYGRYTIGARNLLETDLPENDSKQLVYSSNLYTQAHLGRTVYFNFSVDL